MMTGRLLSTQRLHDILRQLGKESEKVIDRDVASQVAEKARAKWMLLRSIPQVDPHAALVVQLIDVASGTVVGSQRVTGEGGEDIFSLIDRLTVEVKEDLSLPAASRSEPDRPVADATTHSEEAYRYSLEAEDLMAKSNTPDAIRSLQKAVELDSTMAMAYGYIGLIGTTAGMTEPGTR